MLVGYHDYTMTIWDTLKVRFPIWHKIVWALPCEQSLFLFPQGEEAVRSQGIWALTILAIPLVFPVAH